MRRNPDHLGEVAADPAINPFRWQWLGRTPSRILAQCGKYLLIPDPDAVSVPMGVGTEIELTLFLRREQRRSQIQHMHESIGRKHREHCVKWGPIRERLQRQRHVLRMNGVFIGHDHQQIINAGSGKELNAPRNSVGDRRNLRHRRCEAAPEITVERLAVIALEVEPTIAADKDVGNRRGPKDHGQRGMVQSDKEIASPKTVGKGALEATGEFARGMEP